MMNAENFVAFGFVFWLLLDLIQGAYDLRRRLERRACDSAMLAIGVSAAAMWIGVVGTPWRLPKWLVERGHAPARQPNRSPADSDLLRPRHVQLRLRRQLRHPRDVFVSGRDTAGRRRGARGQLGGWGSFIDQMPYFGYVLPSLTALLIVKRGCSGSRTLLAIGATAIMLLFLSQGGGRRIIGVTVGAAIIVWVQAQPGMQSQDSSSSAGRGASACCGRCSSCSTCATSGYQSFSRERQRVRLPARRRQLPAPGADHPDDSGRARLRRIRSRSMFAADPAGAARVLAGQADRSRLRPAVGSSA